MRLLVSPVLWLVLSCALLFLLVLSSAPELWLTSIGAFLVTLAALGWHRAPPVLVWVVAINMLSIWADIATVELNKAGWVSLIVGDNLGEAIIHSSFAMAFLAIGMRIGLALGHSLLGYDFRAIRDPAANSFYSPQRLALAYLIYLPTAIMVNRIGEAAPGLQQPAYVFGLLKFALIYMLAARIFAIGRDYYLVVFVVIAEILIGSTGGWANYKEGFFVILIALARTSGHLNLRQLSVSLIGTATILYLSLAWTAVKIEFRATIQGSDAWTSVKWLAGKYFGGQIDMSAAAITLLDRVGYNKFYAMVMSINPQGIDGIYQRAIVHILTPRILFPDKAILSDSAQTALALGWNIQQGTSIGLGYVAQSHIDFGFPGLLAPMSILGALLGLIYAYFLTRPAPLLIREAIAVACLFNSLAFAGNIDKQLGGLLMGSIVLALALRYGGLTLDRWLVSAPRRSRTAASRAR